ncbi:MAG: hypothetical protein IJ493_09665 [Clostridia bacterium]|nr:hypothetical protein [Clostridia bacterium]
MSKKKHKKKSVSLFDRLSTEQSVAAGKDVKRAMKRFNWQRALGLMLATIAAFAVLEAFISLEASKGMTYSIVTIVYYVIVTVLLIAIVLLNGGFSKEQLTPDMISESVDREEAARICERANQRKQYAKKLMLVLVPFLFAVFFDIVYLFYGDVLKQIFSFLAPGS